MLRLQRVTMKDGKEKLKHVDGFFVDNPFVKSHSQTEIMNVYWRALEPGDYLFDPVVQNPMMCEVNLLQFRFTVVAGQTLYLGNYRIEGTDFFVRDQYSRDLEFFTAHANGTKPAAFTSALSERVVKKNPRCQQY